MTKEELEIRVAKAAGVVKLVCGLGNNAAWMVCLDAHDVIKKHSRYNQRTKGGHTVGYFYRKVLKMYRDYERMLLCSSTNRFFHVADMSEETRKKYGDITDRQYYEFWTGIGGAAYTRSKPMVTSLQNKYRLSLMQHGIAMPEMVAWVMTAQACLELAVTMYEKALVNIEDELQIPRKVLDFVFGRFSMKEIAKVWRQAMEATEPNANYELEGIEERNIEQGIIQLQEAWSTTDGLYGATMDSVKDFDEVFRTKGEMKKAMREIAEAKAEVDRQL
jgi:hypothetical protein